LRLPKWRVHLIIHPVSPCEFALNNLAIAILGPNSIGPDPFDFSTHLISRANRSQQRQGVYQTLHEYDMIAGYLPASFGQEAIVEAVA